MRQSQLFTKTRKEAPKDEVAKNAQLLIRAGYIHKEMAGVYSYLPLGLRVLDKIARIIRDEMNKIDGQEILMSSFHPKENWEKTRRWESMDDLYKVSDSSGREVALGPTHEEIVVPILKEFIGSYKDLPRAVYQIQNKFRMELRSKSGILRGREFIMKDLYSFHTDADDLDAYYERVQQAYKTIFDRAGIGEQTYMTFASGGSFSKYSHEYQTLTDAGEDIIHICDTCRIAINKEILADQPTCPQCGSSDLREAKAVEVGNIFKLMTKYSDPFALTYKDSEGSDKPVIMGCYGIGLGRLLGTVVEVLSDNKGIVWPKEIAPYRVHIAMLGTDEAVRESAEDAYKKMTDAGIEVLFDDRDVRAGEKFADSDLIGIPTRVIISEKTVASKKLEVVERASGEAKHISLKDLIAELA